MRKQPRIKMIAALAAAAVFFLMAGCGGISDAQTGNRQVITFNVNPGTFQIVSANPVTFEILESTTRYTLPLGDTQVLFTTLEGISHIITNMEANDVIIERPLAGTLTLILRTQQFFQ